MATTKLPRTTEILRPPEPPGPVTWLRRNLFSTWYNSLLTVLSLALIVWSGTRILRWLFLTADWSAVVDFPLLYLVGQYPRESLWRLGAGVALLSLFLGAGWRVWGGVMRTLALVKVTFLLIGIFWPAAGESITPAMRLFLTGCLALIPLGWAAARLPFVTSRRLLAAGLLLSAASLVLLHGLPGVEALPVVRTGLWGGLLVTLFLAVGGIVLSFPIGVVLALGRRSSLPMVRVFSTTFIEVVRGVPLIGILFLFSLILPLFLPTDVRFDRLMRALVAMIIFSAAYMAENVRGGLAAIPPGQVEAAKAVGLRNYQVTMLVVLPQALRLVIPPIVGQFIALFKDTTLASGVAVLEFLSVGRSILQANPEYYDNQTEVYIFLAAVFWIFCYIMSYASQQVETALGVGER